MVCCCRQALLACCICARRRRRAVEASQQSSAQRAAQRARADHHASQAVKCAFPGPRTCPLARPPGGPCGRVASGGGMCGVRPVTLGGRRGRRQQASTFLYTCRWCLVRVGHHAPSPPLHCRLAPACCLFRPRRRLVRRRPPSALPRQGQGRLRAGRRQAGRVAVPAAAVAGAAIAQPPPGAHAEGRTGRRAGRRSRRAGAAAPPAGARAAAHGCGRGTPMPCAPAAEL